MRAAAIPSANGPSAPIRSAPFAVDNQDNTEDGVWQTTDDNILALLEENATDVVVAGEYCVRGDELVIRDQASNQPYTWILRR